MLLVLAYLHGLGVVGSEELEAVVGARGVSSVLADVKHCETKEEETQLQSPQIDLLVLDLKKAYFYCIDF